MDKKDDAGHRRAQRERPYMKELEFFRVKTPEQVLALIKEFSPAGIEEVPLVQGLGRVLACELPAPEDLPSFPRSAMDGFAVRARDTFGASEALPGLFEVVGEVGMGEVPEISIGQGQTVRIYTGGVLPQGADAVVMLEYAQMLDEKTVELSRPVSPLEHVIQVGEDISRGSSLLPIGHRLRPQDLGLLGAEGITRIPVYKKPRVAVMSTGDEIVPPTEVPPPGKIRDINSITLTAQVEAWGGIPLPMGIIQDQCDVLRTQIEEALASADLVLISGGSSVGSRDYTLKVIQSFPDSEILVHGIAISPGKPTILARVVAKPIWGLPGHAASAMIVSLLFVKPLIRYLAGEKPDTPDKKIKPPLCARLTRNCPSAQGREEYIRVTLTKREGEWWAEPIFGKSGLISTLVKAQGVIRIPKDDEGMEEGTLVEVILF